MSSKPGDIRLEAITGLEDHFFTASHIQTSLWHQLETHSVEAISANRGSLFDFSAHDCAYSAIINESLPSPKEGEQEGQPRETEHGPTYNPAGQRYNEDAWYAHAEHAIWEPWPEEGVAITEIPSLPSPAVGFIYLTTARFPGSMNLGVVILPEKRGKGYGTEAVHKVLDLAFRDFQCHRIQVQIVSRSRSEQNYTMKMFMSMGFRYEGLSRRSLLVSAPHKQDSEGCQVDGGEQWRDITTLALLDLDWVVLREMKISDAAYIKSQWEEMFSRHERESEFLLAVEERAESRRPSLRKTSSMETVKHEPTRRQEAQAEIGPGVSAEAPLSPTYIAADLAPILDDSPAQQNHITAPPAPVARDRSILCSPLGGSGQDNEDPAISDVEPPESHAASSPRSSLSFDSGDSDAESDWSHLEYGRSSRASQSGSEWDLWEASSDSSLASGSASRSH